MRAPRRSPLAVLAAAALVAAVAAPLGCVRGALPARELYRLRTAGPADAPPDSTAGVRTFRAPAREAAAGVPVLDLPLAVEAYAEPGVYTERQMVYRVGETRYGN